MAGKPNSGQPIKAKVNVAGPSTTTTASTAALLAISEADTSLQENIRAMHDEGVRKAAIANKDFVETPFIRLAAQPAIKDFVLDAEQAGTTTKASRYFDISRMRMKANGLTPKYIYDHGKTDRQRRIDALKLIGNFRLTTASCVNNADGYQTLSRGDHCAQRQILFKAMPQEDISYFKNFLTTGNKDMPLIIPRKVDDLLDELSPLERGAVLKAQERTHALSCEFFYNESEIVSGVRVCMSVQQVLLALVLNAERGWQCYPSYLCNEPLGEKVSQLLVLREAGDAFKSGMKKVNATLKKKETVATEN